MTSGAAARLWRGGSIAPAPAATPIASALALIGRLAPRGTVELIPLATAAITGGDLVRVEQRVDGIAVDGGELRVLVGSGGALVAASGVLVGPDLARDRTGFLLDGAGAVTRAMQALHGVDVGAGLRSRASAADASWFTARVAGVTVEEARARKRWFRDGDALVAAWVVESYSSDDDSTDTQAYRTVIAARDGRVLASRSLTASEFRYRVWAETTGDKRPLDGPTADFSPHPSGVPGAGRPAFIPPSFVTVDALNHPATGGPDSWLAPGATETVGNNVDAYSDVNAPSGLSAGDFRASVTAAGSFDRIYDTAAGPLASNPQQQAAITQLFYGINWLHDDWYDAGFTEALGNGQTDNYGRGGVAGDALRAEAQDGANDGNRNNANMSTPDDGMAPRMQVYLWSGDEDETFTSGSLANAPANGASYGPPSYDLTGALVLGVDRGGASTNDGCEALTNAAAVSGKIVLLERGGCSGKRKSVNAAAAGAIGAIISHNVAGSPPQALPNDAAVPEVVSIPSMSMSFTNGATLRTALGAGPVQISLHRVVGPEADGSLDAGLLAHEFGHYVHHRLSLCGTAMCGAMSEGWGDFIAMMTIARAGDDLTGAYALSTYAYNGDPYFGLRRAPYSSNMRQNAFTFRMVAEGEALPTSHPVAFGGSNAEVHNAGEIWAEALWEGYVALQQARGSVSFDDTRRKMQRYVVAGLSLAPPDGSFTEVRDAILAAVDAASPADHALLADAYARRGLGSCALSPGRDSTDFIGTAESFDVRGHALSGPATVAIDVKDCDHDGTLDVGETATVTVPIANAGAVALTGVTVSVASATSGLTVITEPVAVGSLAPYADATSTFQVRLDGATGPAAGLLNVTIVSPGGCAETQQVALPIRLAADDAAAASAADSFDAATSPWSPDGNDAQIAWHHATASALDRLWIGTDLGTNSDTSLISPTMIAGTGAVSIEFDHTYEFEFSDQYYDGGVIELSDDSGASWVDVSTLTSVPYNAQLGVDSGNPIGGVMAFGDRNPSFPDRDRVTLDFGTQLAGKTFALRFRIGTDAGVGAPGWKIDNLAATGITNQPFPVQGADGDACGVDPSVDGDDGGCCSTGGSPALPIGAGLLVAGLLVRRRRRR